MISAVVLAAGRGTRFGSTKQLFKIEGKPLAQHAIDVATGGGLDEIVIVLGHDAERVGAALVLPPNARTVLNERFAEGQSTSLAAGIGALDASSAAAVVLLGDQPGILPNEVRELVTRFAEIGAPIVRLRYRDGPGPVLLSREIWREVQALRGDTGARELFEQHTVEEVAVERDAPVDIDSPGDVVSSSA
ncbi:MAG: nucleotidyltransferase family protein [Actinomycetota bacterium]|nr:nucleotidyltransferase family protein [Actinomycetota bacterium]